MARKTEKDNIVQKENTIQAETETKTELQVSEETKNIDTEVEKDVNSVEQESKTENVESINILKAITSFNDKYTGTKYKEGTEFIIDDVEETEKVGENQYKISNERAVEIQAKGYIK